MLKCTIELIESRIKFALKMARKEQTLANFIEDNLGNGITKIVLQAPNQRK